MGLAALGCKKGGGITRLTSRTEMDPETYARRRERDHGDEGKGPRDSGIWRNRPRCGDNCEGFWNAGLRVLQEKVGVKRRKGFHRTGGSHRSSQEIGRRSPGSSIDNSNSKDHEC